MDGSSESQPEFAPPPVSFVDQTDRAIEVEHYTGSPSPLVEMYDEFDTSSQSQGVPPRRTAQVESWVEHLLEEGENVVAVHDGDPVGHAVLIPYDDTSELAIFVHPEYQTAGIGTRLIRGLLGRGQSVGIEHVWLTVSRDNRIAMRLYRSAGFEVRDEDRGELEMERDL
ncbi:MAG: N-acetyltransferase family protein [Natrialbaceae archaeon]